jgi:hypothetical protein
MLVGHIHDDGEHMVRGTWFENGEEKLFQFFGAEFGHSESVIEMGHSIEYEMRRSEKRKIVGAPFNRKFPSRSTHEGPNQMG